MICCKIQWKPLCIALVLLSLAARQHTSPLFAKAADAATQRATDSMTEEERQRLKQERLRQYQSEARTDDLSQAEKMRVAQEFLDKQKKKGQTQDLNKMAGEYAKKLKEENAKVKERDERRKRMKEREDAKKKYTQAEKDERRRRADEYLKWKEAQEEKKENEEEDNDFSYFVTLKPRDLFEGSKLAFSNVLRGAFYGIAAFLGSPFSMAATEGLVGFVKGIVAGTALGVGMPIAGAVIGLFQFGRGLIAQPFAFKDGFIDCKIWNETERIWEKYILDEDLDNIREALDEEEKKSGSRGRGDKADYKSSKVKSTEYYDLLGVQPDATSSQIRSAYRKMARTVHPDKNPDDPDAERKFRELSAAYQTLSDSSKRKQYDSSGVGVDPEQVGGQGMSLDPYVFFAVLFGSEQVENYIGELGLASSFDAFMKLAEMGDGSNVSFESWDDVKSVLGWTETALKRRKRETDIAIFLRQRISDYVEGYLTADAFRETCHMEAETIANGGSYGASFLSAIGPALVAEADSFLGYRASVIGSWRGPVSGVKKNMLFLRRKISFAKAVMRTVKEGFKALYDSAEVVPDQTVTPSRKGSRQEKVKFDDKDKLKSNFANTIPSIINMAWAINFVDISNTLAGACTKLFYDASVSSKSERLRRAEAVQILGSQFYLVAMEITGGNTTVTADVDDIKARATAAFTESVKKGMEKERDRSRDEM